MGDSHDDLLKHLYLYQQQGYIGCLGWVTQQHCIVNNMEEGGHITGIGPGAMPVTFMY